MPNNDQIIVCTVTWKVKVTQDELINLALDAGIDDAEPSDAELETAFNNFLDKLENDYSTGQKEIPEDAKFNCEAE